MENNLSDIAKQLHALDRSEIKAWLRRGELLTQARALCSAERDFAAWLRTNDQARTTAYRAMAAWRDFGSVPTSGRFSKEAMAVLSGHPEAIADATRIAANGHVTARMARKLVGRPVVFEETTSVGVDRLRVYTGDGWKIRLELEQPGTDSDFMAALSQALRQVQGSMSSVSRLLNRSA